MRFRIKGIKAEFYDKLSEDEQFRINAYAILLVMLLVFLAQLAVIL